MSTGRDITLRRVAAVGDAVWATSLFPALKKRAEAQGGGLYFSTHETARLLFSAHPHLAGVLAPNEARGQLIDLTDTYERTPKMHPAAAYAAQALLPGEELTPPFLPRPTFTPEPVDFVLHPAVSWANRTLPREFWRDVIDRLARVGSVALVGTAAEVVGLSAHAQYFTGGWPDTAARIASARVFVGSDSGPLQIAAALGVACVGLYTCARSELRRPILPRAKFVAFDTHLPCGGCLHDAPPPVRFFDCRFSDDARHLCVKTFVADAVADAAADLVFSGRDVSPVA